MTAAPTTIVTFQVRMLGGLPMPLLHTNVDAGYIGDYDLESYISIYLKDAQKRVQQYAPSGFSFSINDVRKPLSIAVDLC